MADKRLLTQRIAAKKRKPRFARQDSHKKVKLAIGWRRPKGLQSKLRLRRKGHRAHVSVGYGSPAAVRGLDRSGLVSCLVHTPAELEALDAKTHGVLIGSTVGMKSKVAIVKVAQRKNLTILNVKDPSAFLKAVEDDLSSRKASKAKKQKGAKEKERESKDVARKKEQEKKVGIEGAVDAAEKKAQEKKELDKVLTTKQ